LDEVNEEDDELLPSSTMADRRVMTSRKVGRTVGSRCQQSVISFS
jgi:hypothetical protein